MTDKRRTPIFSEHNFWIWLHYIHFGFDNADMYEFTKLAVLFFDLELNLITKDSLFPDNISRL